MFSPLARVVRLAQVLACALSVGSALSAPWVGPDAKSSTFLRNFCSFLLLMPPIFISASHNLEKHQFLTIKHK